MGGPRQRSRLRLIRQRTGRHEDDRDAGDRLAREQAEDAERDEEEGEERQHHAQTPGAGPDVGRARTTLP